MESWYKSFVERFFKAENSKKKEEKYKTYNILKKELLMKIREEPDAFDTFLKEKNSNILMLFLHSTYSLGNKSYKEKVLTNFFVSKNMVIRLDYTKLESDMSNDFYLLKVSELLSVLDGFNTYLSNKHKGCSLDDRFKNSHYDLNSFLKNSENVFKLLKSKITFLKIKELENIILRIEINFFNIKDDNELDYLYGIMEILSRCKNLILDSIPKKKIDLLISVFILRVENSYNIYCNSYRESIKKSMQNKEKLRGTCLLQKKLRENLPIHNIRKKGDVTDIFITGYKTIESNKIIDVYYYLNIHFPHFFEDIFHFEEVVFDDYLDLLLNVNFFDFTKTKDSLLYGSFKNCFSFFKECLNGNKDIGKNLVYENLKNLCIVFEYIIKKHTEEITGFCCDFTLEKVLLANLKSENKGILSNHLFNNMLQYYLIGINDDVRNVKHGFDFRNSLLHSYFDFEKNEFLLADTRYYKETFVLMLCVVQNLYEVKY